jgi:hypothetical protein
MFLGFDPGFNQAIIAVGVMVGISVSIACVYLFAQVTHAMWIEAPAGVTLTAAMAAQLHLQHHGATLLAMLMGGLVGMLAAFTVVDTKPRDLAITMTAAPIPMLATMALSIELVHERTIGIAVMAVVMGIGVWMPRLTGVIGGRAFFLGMLLFVGYLFGFLSNGAVKESQLGWIAAILWFSTAVNFLLKLLIFAPLTYGALKRTTRAFFARARGVIAAAADLYPAGSTRARARTRRRLRRRLVGLNEAALIIDGLLGNHPEVAHETHERLFDTEVTVHNIGRLADALSEADLPDDLRWAIGASLAEVRDARDQLAGEHVATLMRASTGPATRLSTPEAGRVTRLAAALIDWPLVLERWRLGLTLGAADVPDLPFESPVTLIFGNLPGSSLVSRTAAKPAGSRRARLGLDSFAQTGVRIAVAVAVAGAIGSIVSQRRFYWAVIAVFIAFVGANTSGEQVTKAFNRVVGTVIGILLGSLLARAVGVTTWSAVVIVVSISLGVYFMRVSYALMVIGLTVMVSQLYVQLGEYSNSLLALRLEETTIGAVVAALAALLVFPVRTHHAVLVAARDYFATLRELLDGVAERLRTGRAGPTALTTATRGLDHAAQQLMWTARPLARGPFRRDDVEHNLFLFEQTSYHATNVAAGAQRAVELAPAARAAAIDSLSAQADLAGALERHLQAGGSRNADAASTAALADELRRRCDALPAALDNSPRGDERLLLRHVVRLDETLAELGDNLLNRRVQAVA